MSDVLRVTVLGCGSSTGSPRIGGDWGNCDPTNPKNARLRSSILVERSQAGSWAPETTTTVLVDTAPDMRQQLLRAGVGRLDAVLYTHDHADQTHGVDDLRMLAQNMRRRVPVHMDEATAETLLRRFDYCFVQREGSWYPPILEAEIDLEPGRVVRIDGPGGVIEGLALAQVHGPVPSLGFRFGAFAYSNDVSDMPEETFAALSGLDVWMVDALRYAPHGSHANLETAMAWIERVAPKRAYLTNLHVDLDYARVEAETPSHVSPAHDGLVLMTPVAPMAAAREAEGAGGR